LIASRTRRVLLGLAIAAGLLGPGAALGQKPGRVHRIGLLLPGTLADTPWVAGLDKAFRERGYVEGTNLVVERRYGEGHDDRLPALAAELVRAKVEVLMAGGPAATRAAAAATTTVPIVMGTHDPVEQGLIASLAKPGGNVTGWCFLSAETVSKQLAVLRDAMPQVTRVAVMVNPRMAAHEVRRAHIQSAAQAMGLQLVMVEVASAEALLPAFEKMRSERAEAFLLIPEPSLIDRLRTDIVGLAARHRLPAMYAFRMYPEAGGLMSYGPSLLDLMYLWPGYVDKILKGARPGELPVETPRKYELVLNQRTARELGFTFPHSLVLAADATID
jgi:putative ABC transport system substrate-binding protein